MSAYLGSIKVWDSSSAPAPAEWVRPSDWLAMPTIGETEEKIVGLHAVWPTDGNFCAFTISGAFTVDWGDGTVEDFASGATAYHEYDYDDADLDGTESTRGYKQALVVITPQSGQNLTGVNFQVKHNQSGLVDGYATGWLDIAFGAPSCTALTLGGTTVRHSMLERFVGVSCGSLTSMSNMFLSCYSIASLDLSSFDTSAVTSMAYMFYSCTSIASLDLSSFDTSAVTSMASMFYNCTSIASLDLSSFDTSAVTSMAYMFYSCTSIASLDLSSFDTSAVTSMAYMFYNCTSLASLDLSSFDTSAVTNMSGMFLNCNSIASLDLSSFDTSAVTSMASMFYNCTSIASLLFPCNQTFDVSNGKLSAAALDALYTSLPAVTGKTITVTGNYGVASDTPSIATNKGWVVTG